jgi:acyl-CoA synthetase (NDP forming)
VQFVHILTAGFSETGLQTYADIERHLIETAKKGGIRVIGPNCMGIYCPEGGVAWSDRFPRKSGSIGLFSQSGQLAYQIIGNTSDEGLYFSKVASFGNASDLAAHDFLDYLATDEKTEIIGAYIEGLKHGRTFFEVAKNTTLKKPLVIWKGGQTEGGSRATLSHTAAIAGSHQIWNAMCKQAGIISVNTMEELIFTIMGLKYLSIPKGVNIAVLGGAGGGSVTMTDVAENQGLRVPHLADETIRRMGEFIHLEGNSFKNPLDILPVIVPRGLEKENIIRIAELLRDDPNIDAMIFNAHPVWIYESFGRTILNRYLELSVEAMKCLEKPSLITLPRENGPNENAVYREVKAWYKDAHVPTFPDFSLAAKVLSNMKQYGDYLSISRYRDD